MAYDNSNVKPPIIDLLYPSENSAEPALSERLR